MIKNIDRIKAFPDIKIKDALKIMKAGAIKIVIVVNDKNKLIGTLTDGDIRRGFLKGLNLNDSIKSLIFTKPIVVKKNYTKEEVLKISLLNKIYQIPVVDENFKVIGIHVLNDLISEEKKLNKIVIMAGGKGKRLLPLTKTEPKPMLKIGKKPILQTLIEGFRQDGYVNFIICVNYKSKIIKDYFKNGEKFGVKIEYIEEKKPMGTVGALSLLKKKPDEPFFVVNGDLLVDIDLGKVFDFHKENKSIATMCIKEYNIEYPYGEVKIKKEKIISIHEKPIHKFFINAGVYLLDPVCIDLVPNKFFDMTSLFKKILSKKLKAVSFPLGEYWMDIGRHDDFKKARLEYENIFKK